MKTGDILIGLEAAMKYNITTKGTEWIMVGNTTEKLISVARNSSENQHLVRFGQLDDLFTFGVERDCFKVIGSVFRTATNEEARFLLKKE